MNLETVKYEKKDSVALITFNRPEVRNAFNAKMTEDILEALVEAKNDSNIRVIVLTGEGLSFRQAPIYLQEIINGQILKQLLLKVICLVLKR